MMKGRHSVWDPSRRERWMEGPGPFSPTNESPVLGGHTIGSTSTFPHPESLLNYVLGLGLGLGPLSLSDLRVLCSARK
jgi:hypothetical protein